MNGVTGISGHHVLKLVGEENKSALEYMQRLLLVGGRNASENQTEQGIATSKIVVSITLQDIIWVWVPIDIPSFI